MCRADFLRSVQVEFDHAMLSDESFHDFPVERNAAVLFAKDRIFRPSSDG